MKQIVAISQKATDTQMWPATRSRRSQKGVQRGAAGHELSKELRRCDLLLTNAYSILKHGINDLYIWFYFSRQLADLAKMQRRKSQDQGARSSGWVKKGSGRRCQLLPLCIVHIYDYDVVKHYALIWLWCWTVVALFRTRTHSYDSVYAAYTQRVSA